MRARWRKEGQECRGGRRGAESNDAGIPRCPPAGRRGGAGPGKAVPAERRGGSQETGMECGDEQRTVMARRRPVQVCGQSRVRRSAARSAEPAVRLHLACRRRRVHPCRWIGNTCRGRLRWSAKVSKPGYAGRPSSMSVGPGVPMPPPAAPFSRCTSSGRLRRIHTMRMTPLRCRRISLHTWRRWDGGHGLAEVGAREEVPPAVLQPPCAGRARHRTALEIPRAPLPAVRTFEQFPPIHPPPPHSIALGPKHANTAKMARHAPLARRGGRGGRALARGRRTPSG